MTPAGRRRRAAALVVPTLGPHEQIHAAAPAWFALLGPSPRLLFAGRRVRDTVLTSERLVVVPRVRRAGAAVVPLLDVRLDALGVVRTRPVRLLAQVVLRCPDGRHVVLELRPRDHALARALVASVPVGVPAPASPSASPA